MRGCLGGFHDDLVRIFAAQWVLRGGLHHQLEVVRIIVEEGKKMDAKEVLIGGDLDIELKLELKLEGGSEDFVGLDRMAECRGGGEDVVTYEKKLRCLQFLSDFFYLYSDKYLGGC